MARLNRRTKVISIRLSDQEYDQLQNLCAVKGAESLSELARAGMKLLVLEDESRKTEIESRISEMQTRVGMLDREVARLSTVLGIARLEEAT